MSDEAINAVKAALLNVMMHDGLRVQIHPRDGVMVSKLDLDVYLRKIIAEHEARRVK